MSLLIVGATGTLGRQIVRKALDEGFNVKCLVRNLRRGAFLKEWGAELVYGDLKVPDTIPPTMKGITAVIDASTARTSDQEYAKKIDLLGKIALIEAAEQAGIQRFIFFSILHAKRYPEIALMEWKNKIEKHLQEANINYTVFHIGGFFQGIISQYALPVLDKQSIWITKDRTSIAYIDTLDIAQLCIRSLSLPNMDNKTLPMLGRKSWNAFEIIEVCEKLSGQKAKISTIPIWFLQLARNITQIFEWSWNISERLAFSKILSTDDYFTASMKQTYHLLNSTPNDLTRLEEYLQEYFNRIMKKLKTLNYTLEDEKQDIKF